MNTLELSSEESAILKQANLAWKQRMLLERMWPRLTKNVRKINSSSIDIVGWKIRAGCIVLMMDLQLENAKLLPVVVVWLVWFASLLTIGSSIIALINTRLISQEKRKSIKLLRPSYVALLRKSETPSQVLGVVTSVVLSWLMVISGYNFNGILVFFAAVTAVVCETVIISIIAETVEKYAHEYASRPEMAEQEAVGAH